VPEDDLQALLQTGIEAAQTGRPAVARALFDRVIARDPDHELAWLWKATVAETPEERRACLRRVLVINPENLQAGQALQQIQRQTPPAARRPPEPPPARQERARLLASDAPARQRRLILPLALVVVAIGLMAAGAGLLLSAQRDTPATPPPDRARELDEARTATLHALLAPVSALTATPAAEIRTLPGRRDRLPATWTPTATWTASPAFTPTAPTATPGGQTRHSPASEVCARCLTADLEGT